MKAQPPVKTPEGRLAVARHIEELKDAEATKPPAQRRTDEQLRHVARARWHEGQINGAGDPQG